MRPTTADRQSARRRAATGMAATALVGDVARKLAPHGISVMPMKGALLQHWLYDDPSERAMTDVDLLLLPEELERAAGLLEASNYRRTEHQSVGGVVMETPFGLALDLHPGMFDRFRYRLPAQQVFARGNWDEALFGVRVRLPSPLDAYAHLIGKAGSDHLHIGSVRRLDEIARMGRRLHAAPKLVARHLHACGMQRVSRYALPLVYEATGDRFALEVAESLSFDPIGRAIAHVARRAFAVTGPSSSAGSVMAHLLNESLPRGAYAGARGMLARRGR